MTFAKYRAFTDFPRLYNVVQDIDINNININKGAMKYVRKENRFSTMGGREVVK